MSHSQALIDYNANFIPRPQQDKTTSIIFFTNTINYENCVLFLDFSQVTTQDQADSQSNATMT